MEAKNSLVVWCIEREKKEDSENVFCKAHAKNVLLIWKSGIRKIAPRTPQKITPQKISPQKISP